LASDRVRHVGDNVAFIVAQTLQQARDAAELLTIDYETLPAILNPALAIQGDSPSVWDEAANNTSYLWEAGDRAATDAQFAQAHRVCRLTLEHNGLVAAPMEPRGAIGVYEKWQDRYTLHSCVQDPQGTHSVVSQHGLGIDGSRLRVVVPDVGGGFGMKNFAYPEHVLVLWAARKVGRPVKWIADRSESFLSDDQGRRHVSEVELALDADGTFLAIRARFLSNVGAYLTTSGSRVSTVVGSRCLTGVYAIGAAHVETRGVFTNMTPTGSYRGAGKPEFIYIVERLVDVAARELGVDPVALRRRNLVSAAAMPFRNPMGDTFDVGDFAKNLDDALRLANRDGFAERRRKAREGGKLRGFGFSIYMEPDGLRDGRARIVFDTTGAVTVAVSAQSNGQGHETTFAQIAADRLGVPVEQVRVLQGDTDRTGFGGGTGGSRSVTVIGSAIVLATDKIVKRGKCLTARMLSAKEDDIDFADGVFVVRGTNRSIDIRALARASYSVLTVPLGEELGLEASGHAGGHVPNFSSGCHVCEVEITPETGSIAIVNYLSVDDFGQMINPMLVEGQVHGGVVQGIGQALCENCVYDEDSGQLLTGSLMDYRLPKASDFPRFTWAANRTDATTNPLGVKGAGEAGTTAAPPAVINAIVDALSEFGVRHIDMPATPEKIWRACQGS
jgi:carbon-monoxide dehydrogenase large subunit